MSPTQFVAKHQIKLESESFDGKATSLTLRAMGQQSMPLTLSGDQRGIRPGEVLSLFHEIFQSARMMKDHKVNCQNFTFVLGPAGFKEFIGLRWQRTGRKTNVK